MVFYTLFLEYVYKLFIIEKYFVSLQKIMVVTEIFPSSLVGALHKPSGSAVSNRNLLDNNLRWFESARHLINNVSPMASIHMTRIEVNPERTCLLS